MGKTNKQDDDASDDELPVSDLYYNVEDTPPILETIFFGFQLAVANICFIIMFVVMLQTLICADQDFGSKMFSTVSFMVGVTTIIQTYFGVRIPIFQGPSSLFFLPYMNAAKDPRWGCNTGLASRNETGTAFGNMTSMVNETRDSESLPPWTDEWAKGTGSLMLALAVETILAMTGAIALVVRIVRPVSITVFFILLGIWLHGTVVDFVKVHWGISAFSVAAVLIFSQYIHWIQVPMPAWKRDVGFYLTRLPLFELFPILFGVAIVWAVSAIITEAGGFPDDPADIRYNARTDIHGDTIRNAPVFRFPHPGMFSGIDFSLEYFIIYLVAVMISVLESMGDYCQYALTCCLPRPPAHAFNRGIFMEGFCGMFSALVGMGHATTSYSNIIGLIRITKVVSRHVFAAGGIILIILGVFGKVGAVFVSIPKSVLAGPVFVGWSMLIGATFMNLKQVDLGRTRNQTIIGCSLMLGVFLPFYFEDNPGDIDTGSDLLDRIIISLVTIPFLIGGVFAIFLDNTLPGRILKSETSEKIQGDDDDASRSEPPTENAQESEQNEQIDLDHKKEELIRRKEKLMRLFDPPFITKYTRRWGWTRYVAILPNPYTREEAEMEDAENITTTAYKIT